MQKQERSPGRVANRFEGFWVPLDKNEGVVKRHFFFAMLCSTAWI
jgi:hypothetical protein